MNVPPKADELPRPRSPEELKRVLEVDRAGQPFLLYRGSADELALVPLDPASERITIGRRSSNDIALTWDTKASRAHAMLQRVGEVWTVIDDGLSANGTFVNGERVGGRCRLDDGDVLRTGETLLRFGSPAEAGGSTSVAVEAATAQEVTSLQLEVLRALCRPYALRGAGPPATNGQIAAEVHLSLEAVKSHLRKLFEKFALAELPQNEKRARLVDRAFALGLVSERELAG
ncbi:MAG: FHA domain-containing protein [Thermoleophilaceae bacterium]